ncbi:MAG TPA: pyridoxal phosphate-dependent aminotransferase [candidate division Zixibacteria bacterium]|nr:pyridoxal phosphate-dependent aminotransferase [candidate division Zixibacteria bacterium]
MQYSERITKLGTEGAFAVLAKAKQLEAEGKSIIHLQIGEPDFGTPSNITDAGIKALMAGETHYSPSGGLPLARKTVAEYYNANRRFNIGPENVIIMPGAKPVIYSALCATINEGDEVILPNPGYPTYESVVHYLGAKPVFVKLLESKGFRFDVEELKGLVTPKTRMIVINSPQNPTGGVLTRSDLEAIYELAEKHDLWILTDEIYSRILYDTEFESIGSIPGAMDRTIIVDGMSKTYAMTGWRLGYAVVPKKLADYLFTMAINNFSGTNTFIQYALIEALTGPQKAVDDMVTEFKRRRDVIVAGLNDIAGITCHNPLGAFYVFPNITGTGLSSREFADMMLDQAGVACLAGTSFGKYGEGYIRFSYANSVENIQEALRRIEQTLAGVKQA